MTFICAVNGRTSTNTLPGAALLRTHHVTTIQQLALSSRRQCMGRPSVSTGTRRVRERRQARQNAMRVASTATTDRRQPTELGPDRGDDHAQKATVHVLALVPGDGTNGSPQSPFQVLEAAEDGWETAHPGVYQQYCKTLTWAPGINSRTDARACALSLTRGQIGSFRATIDVAPGS